MSLSHILDSFFKLSIYEVINYNVSMVWFQVGALQACSLAKRGFTVDLYEARPGN